MAVKRTIHLLLPEMVWPLAGDSLESLTDRPGNIEKLLSRAKKRRFDGSDLEQTLFHLFGVYSEGSCDLPSGAVAYLGMGGNPANDCWARATPVQFLADRDRLLMIGPAQLDVQCSEAEKLVDLFNAHFKDDGLLLIYEYPDHWFLKLSDCPAVKTNTIESVVGQVVDEYLPQGNDRGKMLRLLNEIQMLFHQSEVNRIRMTESIGTVNGLWLSGFGKLPGVATGFNAIYSSLSLAKGLAALSNTPQYELHGDLNGIELQNGEIVIVSSAFLSSKIKLDISEWKNSIKQLDDSLGSLMRDKTGDLDLTLYNCLGDKFNITRNSFITGFWKKRQRLDYFFE